MLFFLTIVKFKVSFDLRINYKNLPFLQQACILNQVNHHVELAIHCSVVVEQVYLGLFVHYRNSYDVK